MPKLKLTTNLAKNIDNGIIWIQIRGTVEDVDEETVLKVAKAVEWFRQRLETKLNGE